MSTLNIQLLLENRKDFLNYRYLLPDLVPWLTLSGSNYSYLEQISMVPKMFEPLKFDCKYFSYLSVKIYVVGTPKAKVFLMSTTTYVFMER